MEKDNTMQPTVRVKARRYMEALLRYKTILTAQIFLSKYLHTSDVDLLTAQHMVMGTQDNLKRFNWDSEGVKNNNRCICNTLGKAENVIFG